MEKMQREKLIVRKEDGLRRALMNSQKLKVRWKRKSQQRKQRQQPTKKEESQQWWFYKSQRGEC